MTEKENNRFDETIRSIMDGATEDVPAYIWESVEKRLPRKAKHTIPVPFRILISTAAAAAVVLAILLFSTEIQDGTHEGVIAKVELPAGGTENEFPEILAGIPAPKPLRTDRRMITDAGKALADMNSQNTGTADASAYTEDKAWTDTPAPDKTEQSSAAAEKGGKRVTGNVPDGKTGKKEDTAEQWENFLSSDDSHKGIRAAITLSGNAISNTNATRNSNADVAMAFRPSRNKELKDRVSESSSSSFGIPLSFGIGTKIFFTPRWALGIGVNYTNLSMTFDGTYYQVTENQEYKTTFFSNIRNRQDYIGIPVNAYFNILQGDFINFYAYAGGTVEK